ncbi:MAG TPA: HAD-IIIC family phosphatase [Bryobacteraceae bacterium]|nr:HAD-IIIC family phosphatase [Bryobacteraceae bacterium]
MQKKVDAGLSRDLKNAPGARRLAIAAEYLAKIGAAFQQETIDRLHGEILRAFPTEDRPALLEWGRALPATAAAEYLRARLAADAGDNTASAAHWEKFFALHAGREPGLLLSYARVLADLGRYSDAAGRLRRAIEQHPKYAFFPRAERVLSKLAAEERSWLRECRIGILGNSTTSLLVPILEACAFRDRIRAHLYEGLYGSMHQEALDPGSGLARFRPDIVLLVNHWRDLDLPPVISDENEFIEHFVAERIALWRRLREQFGCHVVQFAFDFPSEEPYGYVSRSVPGGRTRVISLLNLRLHEAAPGGVSILDTPTLQREIGLNRWSDPMAWDSFRQHPATDALPALGEGILAHLRAVLGLTRKVLVVDLDDTLWKGIIGEDGVSGIQIGPGTPAGEAHARLQKYMLDLKSRGVLLAVASKNNPEDARLPFEQHAHMLLRLDDFAAFEANWNDKAESIRTIARRLSLGLDSFVFLDDNPVEREWIRSQLPEVAVVDAGPSIFYYVQCLDRERYFYPLALSVEDQARAEQYRTENAREQMRASAQSLEQFLVDLRLRASVVPVSSANLARVAQLTNKTNQFNLTTRRYNEEQIRRLVADPNGWTAAFHLADRMGDYGIVGVLLCVPDGAPDRWEIDTWLMSCRALGRQMEKYMFDRLIESAQSRGIREIRGVYRRTAKNGIVADLYEQLGFLRAGGAADEVRYSFAVPARPVATATHVQDETPTAVTT